MRILPLVAFALLCAVCAGPVEARAESAAPVARPSTSSGRTGEGVRETPDQVARRYGLAGEILVARGGRVLLDEGYGPVAPNGKVPHKAGQRWRLASITKQVTAVSIMRMVDRGALKLDDAFASPGPAASDGITIRMLLTHHAGLANPDDTPTVAGQFPAFYRSATSSFDYCRSKPGTPNAPFSYNNCDYLLLGQRLEAAEGAVGEMDNALWPGAFAKPGEVGVRGYVGNKPEPTFNLSTFGTAGGLIGTARDVFRFDRMLMTDKLLSPAARAELWKPEGNGSYQALGQWVFPGQLPGCAKPKRIVQRDGEIGGVQTRNFILPDDDLVVIVFTNRSSDDFALGEVWEGKGFVYDLLGAAACP